MCPACGNKTLILDITDDDAECERCKKQYKSVGEVLKIEEEKWLEDHEATQYMMTDRSGAREG